MSLKGIAKETLSLLQRGGYESPSGAVDFAPALAAAVAGTRLYRPSELAALFEGAPPQERAAPLPALAVSAERTQDAARRLVQQEGVADLVLLDFASARNVAGGFLRGAKAQEEDLARSSGLFPCLQSQLEYYARNCESESLLYTDHLIYAPNVPWFRDGRRQLLEAPFLASVIAAPAPNAGEALRRDPGAADAVRRTLSRRAGYVLAVARERGHRTLLLGAWGCGVFENQPEDVADAFLRHLGSPRFAGAFTRVEFAVFDPSRQKQNLEAFRQRVTAAASGGARED